MRIQHNIAALNSYRNLTNNNSAVAKNLEKLSSGYRINRAGDDAAGLAISEKMRAQITGLNTAQKNANDGISLVQTAEGALTEVHSMLNRMVELATQSANGTYADAPDRENLQKEIVSLKDEIDRIAESTNFNGIKLLDGTLAGSSTTTANFKVGGAAGTAGALPPVGTTLGTNTVKHNDVDGANDGTTFSIDLHNYVFDNTDGSKLTISIGDQDIVLEGDGSGKLEGAKLVEAVVAKANDMDGNGTKLTLGGDQAFTAAAGTNGDARVTFTQDNKTTDTAFKEVQVADTVGIKHEAGTAAASSYSLAITAPTNGLAAGTYQINGQELKVGAADTDDITEADTKDATKLAAAIAAKLNGNVDTDYTITSEGAKLVYEPADPANPPAATPSELKLVSSAGNISFGNVVETTKGLDAATANEKAKYEFEVTVDPDKVWTAGDTFTAGGTTFTIADTADHTTNKITAAEAADADTMAGLIAAKLTDQQYAISANGNKIIYEAKVGGEVKGANANDGTTAPQTAPSALSGNNGITIGAMKETVKGRDNGAAAEAAEYEVEITAPAAELAAGTKITISGQEFEVGKDITVTDTTDATKWAALLATKLNSTDADGYAVAANGNKLVYTANTAGAVGGATTDVPAAAPTAPTAPATGESTTVLGTPAEDAGATDGAKGIDYNVSTTVIREAKAGDGYRLASTYFELTKDMVQDKASITIGKSTYTFSADEADKGKDGKVYIGDVKDDLSEIAKRLTDAAAANKTYTVGHDGNRITVTEIKDQTEFAKDGKSTLTTVEAIEKSLGFTSAPTASNALKLQIGDTAEDFNQLRVAVGGMSSKDLGIEGIDIATQAGATDAIDKIKAAINSVSSTRGDLGAVQNRLEHTINNLSVTAENMTAAESRIRDVDMAEEMMAYTKNNILVQAAQAMLAQANQVPQGVLQLLQ